MPKGNPTHGHASSYHTTPTYSSWDHMKQRCLNPNSDGYYKYGAKGITVCARWLSFDNFLEDMGLRPVGLTLERMDNSKGYEPGNCRWATGTEQQLNRGIQSNNTTGHKGVYRKRNKWEARIAELRLGTFATKEEAIAARQDWEKRYGLS